jgi:outer membrane lipoprotein SlyB
MNSLLRMLAVGGLLLCGANAYAQSAGAAVSLEYGTIEAFKPVQAKSSRGAGTLIGGLAGAALADDHPGLGAVAGGLLGGGIQKRATSKELMQYTIKLSGGGAVVVDTEQEDMVVGDCVVVERGQYTNIRRVSSINCQVSQKPEHHVTAADNCQKAKDELNKAKTNDAVEQAVIKVRTLCED